MEFKVDGETRGSITKLFYAITYRSPGCPVVNHSTLLHSYTLTLFLSLLL